MGVRAKRVYEEGSRTDGRRYLVERLWPRGVSKESLQLTEWLKDVAPSPALRAWYGHEPAKFPDFRTRYRAELKDQAAIVDRLAEEARVGTVTLLFAARDAQHCSAQILREVIERQLRSRHPAVRPHRSGTEP
jgi:uncharacterized protein YeaO (DUF488 family)